MASIKNLKKDINFILGDIIEECYIWELENPKEETGSTEAIISEVFLAFDSLLTRVSEKNVANKKSHYKSISKDLETAAVALIAKVNKL
ncbi:MAG: hypothetical protein COB98_00525 [Flavobacteriaceae bacterium]|nr:MAG: hypothetical protein COB98_00525 [Flavobacteriaceae bacterium]